jgi:hypothetical protein
MKYEYRVIVAKARNSPPDYQINDQLKDEYAGWEVVSATSSTSPQFIGMDKLPHIDIVTTVVVRREIT